MDQKLQKISIGAIIIVGIAFLSLNVILFPELAREEIVAGNASLPQTIPYLQGAWVLSAPVFVALHKTYRLILSLRGDSAFSLQSVRLLKTIKKCVVIFNAMIIFATSGIIILVRANDPTEDVTPLFMLGFIFTMVSLVIVTFITVLQRLLREAIRMKSENELTI